MTPWRRFAVPFSVKARVKKVCEEEKKLYVSHSIIIQDLFLFPVEKLCHAKRGQLGLIGYNIAAA
jgi:hypothetical protein